MAGELRRLSRFNGLLQCIAAARANRDVGYLVGEAEAIARSMSLLALITITLLPLIPRAIGYLLYSGSFLPGDRLEHIAPANE
jgi:hypothetical protein